MAITFTNGFTTNNIVSQTENVVTSNLILQLLPSSYIGSGNTWDTNVGSSDATLVASPTYDVSTGFTFNGTSQYATIPNIGNLSQWTVESWFRLTSTLTGRVTSIISNEFDLVNKLNFSIGTNLQPTNANLCVGFYDGTWRTTSGFIPSINTWYQVVGTYDGTTIRQYVNGVADGGTLTYSGTPQSGGEIRLMRRWDGNVMSSNLVNGTLSIIRIYNSAISASDVLQNFNADKSKFGL